MADIDFIKWMCDEAEGFEFNIRSTKNPHIVNASSNEINIGVSDQPFLDMGMFTNQLTPIFLGSHRWLNELYPLLRQQAIEGVNRNPKTTILQLKDCIQAEIWVTEEKRISAEYDLWGTETYAKESALRYIYEQEANR